MPLDPTAVLDTVDHDPAAAPPASPPQAEAAPPVPPVPPAPPASPGAPGGQQMVIDPDTGQHVPLGKYLDMRDQHREAVARARQLEQQIEQQRRSAQPQEIPDPLVDPQGFVNYIAQLNQQGGAQAQQAIENQRYTVSEMMAVQHYGQETVDAAFQAFEEAKKADPTLWSRFNSTRHPWDTLVKWHEQQKLLNSIGADPDAWVAQRYQELVKAGRIQAGTLVAAPQPAAAPSKPAPGTRFNGGPSGHVPAPSLSRAPASGASHNQPVVTGPGATFDSVFKP